MLVFEAARRLWAWPLAAPVAASSWPTASSATICRAVGHRGYDFDQIVDTFAFGTEGIYGTPTYVSATYIFLFMLFGAFLEQAGMIALFNDFAMGMVGHRRGGPAKVCVLSSALMGTITGSGVANVVTSGQFTIPLMKRFGFRAAFAGAVEATSSMGGQIMPPVMGAVAFIMAETLNVPYAAIVKAAIIPALLYFGACFWQVHLEAGKAGLRGMDNGSLPNPWDAVRQHWPLVLPLAALVYLLFAGYTPIFAGTMGLALTVMLILGTPVAALISPLAFRGRVLDRAGARRGQLPALRRRRGQPDHRRAGARLRRLQGRARDAAHLRRFAGRGRQERAARRHRLRHRRHRHRHADAHRHRLDLHRLIISIGEGNLFLSLVLTMVTCLILGMGIPTIPNYIITSSLAGPALLELGVPLIVSHMFVFYFGIMADLTPPVALAAFAAAPMAKESGFKIGMQATKLAIAGYVVPFMAVYTPALMLQDPGPLSAVVGYPAEVAYVVVKACLSIVLWGAAVVGFLATPLARWERALALAAGLLLVLALP